MTLARVWTEREGDVPLTPQNEGDWEACVATAYSMALLYGGVPMAAPYTQKQRELLEAVFDEPQNLTTTDAMSLKVYGVKLRPISVPGVLAALSRPGVGMCLTGTGSPGGYQLGSFLHEVFWIGGSPNGLLYDPLAPAGSLPLTFSASKLTTWCKGIGSLDAREVRKGEFVADQLTEQTITPFPDGPHTCTIAAGATVDGWNLAGKQKSQKWATASTFPADAGVFIKQVPLKSPNGTFYRASAGFYAGLYVPIGQVSIGGPVNPPTTYTQEQVDEAVAEAGAAASSSVAAAAVAEAQKFHP